MIFSLTAPVSASNSVPSIKDSTELGDTEQITPRITVYEGFKAFPFLIEIYPARYISKGNYLTYNDTYDSNTVAATETTHFFMLGTERANALVNEFKAKGGEEPNAWMMKTYFHIYNDGKGSYGKNFKFSVSGTPLMTVDSSGMYTHDLSRNTATSYIEPLETYYSMESSCIGLSGGYYYYNVNTRGTLGQSCTAKVYF